MALSLSAGGIRRSASPSAPEKNPSSDEEDTYIQVERFVSQLQECWNPKFLTKGKAIHSCIQSSGLTNDRLLANLLVQMYGRCGSPSDARAVFDRIQDRNVYSWTIMLKALVDNCQLSQAMHLYRDMCLDGTRPNKVTLINLLGACTTLAQGMMVHSHLHSLGYGHHLNVLNALLHTYGRLQQLHLAERVFQSITCRDVVSWNAMIAVYAQNGHPDKSLVTFRDMDVQPDDITFVSLLDACATTGKLSLGKWIHWQACLHGFERELHVANAVVNMYGKCKSTGDALKMFSKMRERNVISWTGMVAAYAQNGYGREAMELFKSMCSSGVQPNDITFVTILDACFGSATLPEGKWIHSLVKESGLESDTTLMNAVVNMYSKCGSIEEAAGNYHKMDDKNVVTWSSMIAAYARFGCIELAFELFREIVQQGGEVDNVTFVNLMTACSHAGKLEEAWDYFMLMKYDFGIVELRQHYVCIIDLLSRAGKLVEANELLLNMPFHPDVIAWTNFLSACGAYSNVELAADAVQRISHLDDDCSSAYILLANIYASAGRLEEAEKVRMEMKARGMKVVTESSFIWLNNKDS